MIVYVAGPMSGLPDHNRAAFHAAAAALHAAGANVFNPADLPSGQPWETYMRSALRFLLASDTVALLDGWEGSRGARLEAEIGAAIGLAALPLAEVLMLPRLRGSAARTGPSASARRTRPTGWGRG